MSGSLRRVLAVGLIVVVAACGSGGDRPTAVESGLTEPAGWTEQVLEGEPGPDHPVLNAVDGDQAVVAFASDAGVISGFATDGGGRFVAGEPTDSGAGYLALGAMVRFGDGWIALASGGVEEVDGDRQHRFTPRVFRSDDGRTWSAVATTGLDGPADIGGMTVVDGALVAVGNLRTAEDPSQGGFRPVIWRSDDGERWTTVEVPDAGATEGGVNAVVTVGGRALAVGRLGDAGAMWTSDDGGASWSTIEPTGLPAIRYWSDLVVQGDVLLASASTVTTSEESSEGVPVIVRSTDGGRTWREPAEPPPPNRGELAASPLFSGGGRFFALGYRFIDAWSERELCYADIEFCRQGSTVTLYASDDGDRWQRVDTSGIAAGEFGRIDEVVAPDDGRIIALVRAAEGVATWTWPAGVSLPTQDEPTDPTGEVDLLAEGEVPEVGRRYAVPLYTHCGTEWLYVGDEPWRRTDDGIDPGGGDRAPDHWPMVGDLIFGYATLVEEDRIEYSIGDGEVIATYGRSNDEPPPCA